jgi:serine/threonine protein kinase/tetratricopeptide (TPR) repeat protein
MERIFWAAQALASAEERARYLDQACGHDAELRAGVEELLAAYPKAEGFLEPPAGRGPTEPPAPRQDSASESTEGPGTRIGRYKLLELIGEGGMGTVWLAEQREPVQRLVALKIIKAGMDSRQVLARFEAERQALALMDHPNIARVFDGGTTAGSRPYFVMELVKGVPITRYCDEHRLTPRERLELFLPICQAIQHAHQKGIIHRDIKPANVLVAPYDGRPVPKVIDFGVAKAVGQRLTERTLFTSLGAVVGTLEYMSPEQAELNNQDVDTRSDIYALGVLMYELLTGTTPLSRERLKQVAFTDVLRLIREEEPPRPSTRLTDSKETLAGVAAVRHTEPARLVKTVRGELDWIVMKALEKDRNRRYETANGLATDVQHYLADEPVQACPPTVGYRLRKLVRRNKGPMLAVGLVLLVLVAGIIGTTWGLVRADKARADAVAAQLAEAARAKAEGRAKDEAEQALKAERKAKDGETAQRLRAEDNTKLAMAVLDEIIMKEARQRLTPYMQDKAKGLAKNPEQERLEGEFVQKGLKFYEQLARTNATDWAARRARAKAYANVGLLQLDLRNYLESETAWRQAIDLMEELAGERADEFDNRFDLANTYHWFYRAYLDSGRNPAAEEITRHAFVLFEKLAADFPNHRLEAQLGGYACQRNLAGLLQRTGRASEAEKAYREALAISEKLVADFPNNADCRARLSSTLGELAGNLLQQGKQSEAEDAYRQALPNLDKLVAEFPEVAEYRSRRGGTYAELGQWDKATADFAKASELQPAEAHPRYFHATALLGAADTMGYRSLCGSILDRFGKTEERDTAYWAVWPCVLAPEAVAEPALLVSLAEKGFAKAPTDYDCLTTLGAALYRAGRFEDAVKRLDEAAAAYRPDTPSRLLLIYNRLFLAMAHHCLGHADEARQSLDKAVQWMEQASQEKAKDAASKIPMPWNRRLTLELLRREAETLIRSETVPPTLR